MMRFTAVYRFMVRLGGYILGALLLIQFSCASQTVGSSNGRYYEDLSSLRPDFPKHSDSSTLATAANNKFSPPIEPRANVNKKVDGVLDSLDKLNETKRFVDGYTIQLYSGQNREEAVNARNKVLDVAHIMPRLEYTQPKFRVVLGSYFTQLEAQKDLHSLKKHFPNAILVPERVAIR